MAEVTKTTDNATSVKSIAASNQPMIDSELSDAIFSLPAVSAYPQLKTTPNLPVQMQRLPSFEKEDSFKIGVAPKKLPAVRRFVTSAVAQLMKLPSHEGSGGKMKVGPGTQNETVDTETPSAVASLINNGTPEDVNQAIQDLERSLANRRSELPPSASAAASATAASQNEIQRRHFERVRQEEEWLRALIQRSQDLISQQSSTPVVFSGPQQNNNAAAAAASSVRNRPQEVSLSSANSQFNTRLSEMQNIPAPTISAGNNFAAALIPGFVPRDPNASLANRIREQQERGRNQGVTASSAAASTGNLTSSNQQPRNNTGATGPSAAASAGNATLGNQQSPPANQRTNQQSENRKQGIPPGRKK